MKEFITEFEETIFDAEREAKIAALMEGTDDKPGMSREDAEYATAPFVEFMLDKRTMHAYWPEDGQLAFMLASLGRGQSDESRFASIINVMLGCLRDDDKDYFEGRLLERGKKRLPVKQIEAIFEYLTSEWFSARPTQPPSGSTGSPEIGGQN